MIARAGGAEVHARSIREVDPRDGLTTTGFRYR